MQRVPNSLQQATSLPVPRLRSSVGFKMKSICDILRPVLSLLSIVVFCLLGMTGEQLLNLPLYQGMGKDAEGMPAITQFFLSNFNLNAGHFMLSLTPFMILMLGVGFVRRKNQQPDLYGFLFVGIWLLAIAYFLIFVLALLAPFYLSLTVMGDSPVPKVVCIINTVIAIALVAAWVGVKLKTRKPNRSVQTGQE